VGDGTVDNNRSAPVDVVGLGSGVAQITVGSNAAACALTTTGGVKCWGNAVFSPVPVDVAGLTTGVSAVDAGMWHFCALTTAGGVKCWGANMHGQLGDGTTLDSISPVEGSPSAGCHYPCEVELPRAQVVCRWRAWPSAERSIRCSRRTSTSWRVCMLPSAQLEQIDRALATALGLRFHL
jgi:hypothetical protein